MQNKTVADNINFSLVFTGDFLFSYNPYKKCHKAAQSTWNRKEKWSLFSLNPYLANEVNMVSS
jgi:hypothetical protein